MSEIDSKDLDTVAGGAPEGYGSIVLPITGPVCELPGYPWPPVNPGGTPPYNPDPSPFQQMY